MLYSEMSKSALSAELERLHTRYESYIASKDKYLLTRGKPCTEQLKLSMGIFDALSSESNLICESGDDCRNYGLLEGIPEARRLMASLLEVPEENVLVGGNSSLNLMYDVVSFGMIKGFSGCKPWRKLDSVKFLCPSPGYDRHFFITEYFGIEMVTVPLLETGPDMDIVEKLVSEDESIKGMWCIPKYSNPTGITYSDETVRRIAALKPAAKDFRIFWDNAYCVHDLTDTPDDLLNLYEECKKNDTLSLVIMACSTSKITFSGGGISAIAMFGDNYVQLKKSFSIKTIGYNKINQVMHARYLKDLDGIKNLMEKHKKILGPKFDVTCEVLERELSDKGVAKWVKPNGGYFVNVDVMPGCAARVVALCADAGVVLNPAGSTYPYSHDPENSNIRLAPTCPSVEELKISIERFAVCVKIAALEKMLSE